MNRFLLLLIQALLMGLAPGCIEYSHNPDTPGPANPEPSTLSLDTTLPLAPVARSVTDQNKTYQVETIQFDSLSVQLWRPYGEGPHPAIFLFPAIWGDRSMERFAQELVEEGFICLQLPSNRYLQRLRAQPQMNLESLAETLRLQVVEADLLLDWLILEPDVDPERIGIFGASIGSIVSSLLAESDGRIQAAAYLLGGGNLAEIMAAPQGYVKKRLRERIMSENGLTQKEFVSQAVETLTTVDPLTFGGRLDPKRILMVNGRFDDVIPYKNAKELWNVLGRPDWIVLPTGHYTASLYMPYIRHRVLEHFSLHLFPS